MAVDRADLVFLHMVADEEAQKVHDEVAAIFKSNTRQYWTDKFKTIDCCVSPVLSLKESLNNEQVKARNMIATVKNQDEEEVLQFALPLKFSNFDFKAEMPAPLHGEHTEQELLAIGYSKSEIEHLKKSKIIL